MENTDDYSYAREKLGRSVATLIGSGDLRLRLETASLSIITRLEAADFPDELKGDFKKLKDNLGYGKGTHEENVSRLSEEQLEEYSELILSLYTAILRNFSPPQNF